MTKEVKRPKNYGNCENNENGLSYSVINKRREAMGIYSLQSPKKKEYGFKARENPRGRLV